MWRGSRKLFPYIVSNYEVSGVHPSLHYYHICGLLCSIVTPASSIYTASLSSNTLSAATTASPNVHMPRDDATKCESGVIPPMISIHFMLLAIANGEMCLN